MPYPWNKRFRGVEVRELMNGELTISGMFQLIHRYNRVEYEIENDILSSSISFTKISHALSVTAMDSLGP